MLYFYWKKVFQTSTFDGYLNAAVSLMETLTGDRFTHNGKNHVGNFRTGNSLELADASQAMRWRIAAN